MDNEFFSPLTVVKRLGALCLGVMMLYTFGWTAFIAQHEVRTGNHPDLESAAIATANGVGQVATLIVIYSIATTVALDILGGMIMVTARYLENKFVKPLIERHKAEGQSRRQRGRYGSRQSRGHDRGHRRRRSQGQGRRRSRRQPPLDGVEQPPPRSGARRRPLRRAAARVLSAAFGVVQQGRDCRIIH